jgi:hypothetical protein
MRKSEARANVGSIISPRQSRTIARRRKPGAARCSPGCPLANNLANNEWKCMTIALPEIYSVPSKWLRGFVPCEHALQRSPSAPAARGAVAKSWTRGFSPRASQQNVRLRSPVPGSAVLGTAFWHTAYGIPERHTVYHAGEAANADFQNGGGLIDSCVVKACRPFATRGGNVGASSSSARGRVSCSARRLAGGRTSAG